MIIMNTFTIYNIVLFIFSILACASNVVSLIYIRNTFDIKQCLHYILCLDAIIVIVSTLTTIIMFTIFFITLNFDSLTCFIFFDGTCITLLTGPFCNLMISFIRYQKLSHSPSLWKPNEKLVKNASLAILSLILYTILITFINAFFEFKSFNVFNVCLNQEKAEFPNVAFNIISCLVPVLFFIILTNVLDVSSYIWLQTRIGPATRSNSIKDSIFKGSDTNPNAPNVDIPLKASLISSTLFIPIFVAYIIIGSDRIQPLEKYFVGILCLRLTDAIRNPLTASCTFRVNSANAAEDRERNRQVVINEALRQRQERRQGAREDVVNTCTIQLREQPIQSVNNSNRKSI